jgi:protein SCO1/2
LDGFDRSFIGLTGTIDDISAAQRSLNLPPAVRQGEGPDYLVGHAAYVIAFTPDDSARVLYPSGTRQSDWAHDLPILLETQWSANSPN